MPGTEKRPRRRREGARQDPRSLLEIAQASVTPAADVVALATGQTRKATTDGAKAHAAGDDWQADIRAACDAYRRARLGLVEEQHPATSGWGRNMRYVAPSTVDYLGAVDLVRAGDVAPRPVPVAFDAKSFTMEPALCLVPNRPVRNLKEAKALEDARERADRQCAFLLDAMARGWLAFFLVRCAKLERAWIVSGERALKELRRGGSVPLRTFHPERKAYAHHWPRIRASSDEAVARGAPRWDWRRLLPHAFPDYRLP